MWWCVFYEGRCPDAVCVLMAVTAVVKAAADVLIEAHSDDVDVLLAAATVLLLTWWRRRR